MPWWMGVRVCDAAASGELLGHAATKMRIFEFPLATDRATFAIGVHMSVTAYRNGKEENYPYFVHCRDVREDRNRGLSQKCLVVDSWQLLGHLAHIWP